ncbi:hypothetical protein INQ41_02140 [Lysobacter ciconiae]|uniref:Alanine acetyltransferase n=1 Tax=Novilysobacter ciconiae TaxID=2781022 RepID=A0A7S6ZSI7_9GAMM|nr:hypothetical protein [Lysobacter ciconiae]QOW19893.1 hypothetical protein INQ41_02140 [Lysobacter ciconiae]
MSLWTVQQHEWLQALGHPVLLLAGDPSLQAPAAPAQPRSADTGHPQQAARPSPVIVPPSAPDAPAREPVARAARTDAAAKRAALDAARGARRAIRRPLLPSEDPLLLAILRVSGMEAPVFEVAAQAWRIDLVRLRSDPAAKRSLWQQMRKARQNRDG